MLWVWRRGEDECMAGHRGGDDDIYVRHDGVTSPGGGIHLWSICKVKKKLTTGF